MKKFIGKARRSRVKEQRRELEKKEEENDFLYGRTKSRLTDLHYASTGAANNDVGDQHLKTHGNNQGYPDRRGNRKSSYPEAELGAARKATFKPDSRSISMDVAYKGEIFQSTRDSNSVDSDSRDSNVRGSPASRSEVMPVPAAASIAKSAGTEGGGTRGDFRSEERGSPNERGGRNADWSSQAPGTASRAPMATASSLAPGRQKGGGMSQQEMDRRLKQRIKEERRAQTAAASAARSGSGSHQAVGGGAKTSGMSQEEMDRRIKQRIKNERKALSGARGGGASRLAGAMSQEEMDREIKQRVKAERRAHAAAPAENLGAVDSFHQRYHQSVLGSQAEEDDDDLEDLGQDWDRDDEQAATASSQAPRGRMSSGMSQEEMDRRIKQRIKEERRAQTASAAAARGGSGWHHATGGGGKTSGMSKEEMDRRTKQRIKDERKAQAAASQLGPVESFEQRYHQSPGSWEEKDDDLEDLDQDWDRGDEQAATASLQARRGGRSGGMSQEEMDRRIKQRIKEERRAQTGSAAAARGGSGSHHATGVGGKTSGMSQEEMDRRTKQWIKDERKAQAAASQNASGGRGKSSGMSQMEMDREIKQRIKAERRAQAATPAAGDSLEQRYHQSVFGSQNKEEDDDSEDQAQDWGGEDNQKQQRYHHRTEYEHRRKNYDNNNDSELERRRRKQREQQEKDEKLKETIRQQRDAARALRGNGAGTRRQTGPDEQEEKDRRLKDEVRRQRASGRDSRSQQMERDMQLKENLKMQRQSRKSPQSDGREDADNDLERRRRREQEDKDRQLKENLRQQRDAARTSRNRSNGDGYDDNAERRRHDRHGRNRGTVVSSTAIDENDIYADSSFGNSFDARPERQEAAEETSDDQATKQQNLIDLHIAQFNEVAKMSTLRDYDPNELGVGSLSDEEGAALEPNAELGLFEQEERQRNERRRMSHRVSVTSMQINAWHQKYALKKALELAERTAGQEWASSFYRCDPRWQIMKFFDEVAREGGQAPMDENLAASPLACLFNKANVFTVWRPTSMEAIKNMMLGKATGKGLDIKGKSAKKGNISSYVPFIQIYEEAHKAHVRELIKDGRVIRVFYQTESARNMAYEVMMEIREYMLFAAEDAMRVLSDEYAHPDEQELAMKHLMYDDTNLAVTFVDSYIDSSPPVFGLDITERLFWEAFVINQECNRPKGTEWDIGRNSELTFMDMNFKAIRHPPEPNAPRAVVYQMSECSPLEPRTLLMAYEEYGRVKPVVSDFDCFLLGSRGVKYKETIPDDQVELVQWSIRNISEVLDERVRSESTAGWMETWFKVLKKAALKGYYPKTPKYGNGDPKSYEIIEVAVQRLKETGCVRHGAECFNWFFPQEIDDELLVISDTLPGNVKWKYVNPQELQELLMTKIDEGFTFPINPKWVLCDPGWRRVYDKLLASQKPNVQDSLNCWLPPGTGLRREIDAILARHPRGFEGTAERPEGTEERDLMEDNLERYFKIQRAWRKLRLVLFWIRFVREKKREIDERRASQRDLSRYVDNY